MRYGRVLLALIAALLLTTCIDDFEQGAVTATDSGVLQVLHHPCTDDNVVLSLRLVTPVGVIGDGDDPVLWRVDAVQTKTSSSIETFEPGHVPPGYEETVPLDTPLQGDDVAIYLIERQGGTWAFGFQWGSLTPGTVLTDKGPKSRSQWLSYADEGCGASGSDAS